MAHWTCPSCNRDYAYELAQCTWCHVALDAHEPPSAVIKAITEVNAPSVGHEDVPYWCAFVEADDRSQMIVKLDHAALVGDTLHFGAEEAAELAVVGILGTGTMGRGLTELLLSRGHRLVWCGRSAQRLDAAKAKLLERLGRVMDEEQIHSRRSRSADRLGGLRGACGVRHRHRGGYRGDGPQAGCPRRGRGAHAFRRCACDQHLGPLD